MSLSGIRIHDDQVYLNEERFSKPKDMWTDIAGMIAAEGRPAGTRVLDIGCSTGEQIWHLMARFPDFAFTGMDISPNLIARAREKNPKAEFIIASAIEAASYPQRIYDVAMSTGVLQCFDEPESMLVPAIGAMKAGGSLYIHTPVNDDPIDTIIRYRRTEDGPGPWETGWNVFSKETLERIVRGTGRKVSFRWTPFRMREALPKRDDSMRVWTIKTEEDPLQRVNGAGQLVKTQILRITLED